MKTFTPSIHQDQQLQPGVGQRSFPVMAASFREILALLSAVLIAAVVVMFSVWVVDIEITGILGATTWGAGFIFLGLAMESQKQKALLQVATGVALMLLASLQITVSADYTIVSGVLVSSWFAFAVFKSLR